MPFNIKKGLTFAPRDDGEASVFPASKGAARGGLRKKGPAPAPAPREEEKLDSARSGLAGLGILEEDDGQGGPSNHHRLSTLGGFDEHVDDWAYIAELRNEGSTALELRHLGVPAESMKRAGFTARELRIAEYAEAQLVEAGYSSAAIRLAGYGSCEWTWGGFTYASTLSEEDGLTGGPTGSSSAGAGTERGATARAAAAAAAGGGGGAAAVSSLADWMGSWDLPGMGPAPAPTAVAAAAPRSGGGGGGRFDAKIASMAADEVGDPGSFRGPTFEEWNQLLDAAKKRNSKGGGGRSSDGGSMSGPSAAGPPVLRPSVEA